MEVHLSKLKSSIANKHLDAVLVSSVPTITYLTGFSNFSKQEREAYLLILSRPTRSRSYRPRRSTSKAYIITDGRYSETVRKSIKNCTLLEITPKNSFEIILANLAKQEKIQNLGIEENNLTVSEFKTITKYYNNTYHYSATNLRTIKGPSEISFIEKACGIGDKAFTFILSRIKKGVTEKEIAFELEYFIRKQGADISFPPIVAFGKNSSVPHHQTSHQPLASSHQIVLIDFGVKYENYCSDMTRTIFFGKATKEQKRIYKTVFEAQKKALEHLTIYSSRLRDVPSGTSLRSNNIMASDVDKVARDYIISRGYPTIPHSLGHGIGLEVHEAPRLSPKSKDVLKPGMVFSIEPGIYMAGFGGVRIEDLVVLEKASHRLLTHSPKNLIEL